MTTAAELHRVMRSVFCVGGETQIERVLTHAIRETGKRRVNALVFVGDAMEEKVDRLCRLAGELGLLGVPIFLFHEGRDRTAAAAFKQIASLSHGAYLSFDLASAERLKELAGGGRGLCRRRLSRARRLWRGQGRRGAAADRAAARLTRLPMLFLLGGLAILGGFLLLVYLFVNADPARLARNLKWTGIGIAAVAVIALVLLPPAREFAASAVSARHVDAAVGADPQLYRPLSRARLAARPRR